MECLEVRSTKLRRGPREDKIVLDCQGFSLFFHSNSKGMVLVVPTRSTLYPSIDLLPILHPFRQQMRYIAAYNLAVLGGNSQPTSADVSKILKSAGITIDAAAIEKLIAELSGKDINAIAADGMKKMASIPAGGAAAPAAPASSASAAAPAAAESKKEAAKPAKEESDEEMGFGLFD